MEYILSPSILSADFANLGRDVAEAAQAGAKYIHVDVMDGMFVPSISFGMPVLKALRPVTDHVLDVHLMIEHPERYINDFADCGADLITIHAESCVHLDRAIEMIRARGLKTGLALCPSTPLNVLEHLLTKLDMILIMTVNPGFGGQKYIPEMTEKIAALRKMLDEKGLDIDIEVDGGINASTMQTVLEAGANVIVAGSAVFDRKDTAGNVKTLCGMMDDFAASKN